MPGLDFLHSPVPPALPSGRTRDEPAHIQASRVWLGLLQRCQKASRVVVRMCRLSRAVGLTQHGYVIWLTQDDQCGDLELPNDREVAMLCQSGHAEMLMTVLELYLQRKLELHVAKFWEQLGTAWKQSAGIEDSPPDQASRTPRVADEELFAVFVCVLKVHPVNLIFCMLSVQGGVAGKVALLVILRQVHAIMCARFVLRTMQELSAVVQWQCDLLTTLSDQVLAYYTQLCSSEEHAVGVSCVQLSTSVLDSSVDVAAHADSQRIKAAAPAFLARLADLSQRQRMLAYSTLNATAVVDLQGTTWQPHNTVDLDLILAAARCRCCIHAFSGLLQSFFTHCIDVLQQNGLLRWGDAACSHMDADNQMVDDWEAEGHSAILASQVTQVSACLQSLGMSSLLEEACTYVVYNHVQIKVDELALGVFDQEVLRDALQHVQLVELAFLKLTQRGQLNTAGHCEEWRLRLMCLVYESLGAARISELFDIIIEYPDSQPALNDIAACLRYTSLQSYLVSDLSAAIAARLLHAGASASSIIHTYISTIKALGSIEPSGRPHQLMWCPSECVCLPATHPVQSTGSLLAAVAEPIRRYLRSRPDAIRVLVAMVTAGGQRDGEDDAGLSLRVELQKASLAASVSAELALEDPDEAVCKAAREDTHVGSDVGLPPAALAAMQDARSAKSSSPRIGSMASTGPGAMLGSMQAQPWAPTKPQGGADDIIGALIGVFGSVDMFISEYRWADFLVWMIAR
eukprot:365123-Chlamydomonas_euryale.AAC.30